MGQQQPQAVQEEIRFAVVLNGGVSLAVWMGGVVRELDRLVQCAASDGSGLYRELLDMVVSRARVDVIAGTSAGGINGAALALAQVNKRADLGSLRDLWATQGRMESMLRQPFQGSPPSLLRGDEFFLPQLHGALRRLAEPFEPRSGTSPPLDLTITTTLLTGVPAATVDALGQRLWQTAREGRFHFTSGDTPPRLGSSAAPSEDGDRFGAKRIATTVKQLALASRCTAGFPIAFEPSFVPVNERLIGGVPPSDERLRPDMSDVASWANSGGHDRSRFAVDGGLLVNTPTKAVLDGIRRMSASGPVRRIVLLVFPHAGGEEEEVADVRAGMPALTRTLGKIMAAQSGQGSRTYVEEIEKHNVAAASRRSSRLDMLRALAAGDPATSSSPQALLNTLPMLEPHYQRLRIRRVARDYAKRVPDSEWPYERVREAAEAAQLQWEGTLPYVPRSLDPRDILGFSQPGSGWPWGVTTAQRLADSVLDLLRRLVWIPQSGTAQGCAHLRARVHRILRQLRGCERAINGLWETDEELKRLTPDQDYWTLRLVAFHYAMLPGSEAGRLPDHLRPYWPRVQELVRSDSAAVPPVGEWVRLQMLTLANVAGEAAKLLGQVRTPAPGRDPLELGELEPWRRLLLDDATDAEAGLTERQRILFRLLGLEVMTCCLGEEAESGAELAVELVQISLQTTNAFARFTLTPDDKAAGMAINRFSGFLKQSWRINDWTWGRLDAATMLCRTILDPRRLRRAEALGLRPASEDPSSGPPSEVMNALRVCQPEPVALDRECLAAARKAAGTIRTLMKMAFNVEATQGIGPDPVDRWLYVPAFDKRLRDLAVRALDELIPVYDTRVPFQSLERSAKHLADLAAWGMHLQIAAEELPALVKSVQDDRLEGANVRSRGARFLDKRSGLIEKIENLARERRPVPLTCGAEALEAFDEAGIGGEALGEEVTSDQMIRTTVTAAGVAVTVLDGPQFGVAAAKPITRVLRGAALLPYWIVIGLTRANTAARFFAILALAIGGVLAVLALIGGLPGWGAGAAAALGASALLAAFGYAALRSGTIVHGLVLLSPVIPLIAFALYDTSNSDRSARTGVSVVLVIALFVGGLAILGSLPAPVRGPIELLLDKWKSGLLALAKMLLVAVPTILIIALLPRVRIDVWLEDPGHWPWLILGLAVVAVVVHSYLLSRLRAWRPPQNGSKIEAVPLVHASGKAAQWCIVYGLAYIVIGWVLLKTVDHKPGRAPDAWYSAALVTCAVLAVVLILIAPWWLARRAKRRISGKLLAEASPKTYGAEAPRDGAPEAQGLRLVGWQLENRLQAREQAYQFLLSKPSGYANRLSLTRYGRRLARQINDKIDQNGRVLAAGQQIDQQTDEGHADGDRGGNLRGAVGPLPGDGSR